MADFDDATEARLRHWLAEDLLPREPAPSVLEAEVGGWFAREEQLRVLKHIGMRREDLVEAFGLRVVRYAMESASPA